MRDGRLSSWQTTAREGFPCLLSRTLRSEVIETTPLHRSETLQLGADSNPIAHRGHGKCGGVRIRATQMRQRVWRGASKEEGSPGERLRREILRLGPLLRRCSAGATTGAWGLDGRRREDGWTGRRVLFLPPFHSVGGLQKERSLQVRKGVRRSQRVCQATQVLAGGRHSSYRPALVFPRPRRRSASPLEIWHPAILWCVPPSFGGERAGMLPLPPQWLVPWRVSGSGFVRWGRARRSVAPWGCWNRAEWAWADHPDPQVGGLPLAMAMVMAMTMAYEAVCVFSRDDRS